MKISICPILIVLKESTRLLDTQVMKEVYYILRNCSSTGCVVIERHVTLDKSLEGPDHQVSLLPEELKQLVQGINNIQISLGSEHQEHQRRESQSTTFHWVRAFVHLRILKRVPQSVMKI